LRICRKEELIQRKEPNMTVRIEESVSFNLELESAKGRPVHQVQIHRAQDIGENKPQPTVIIFGDPIPSFKVNSEDEAEAVDKEYRRTFYDDAVLLAQALLVALPGGTLDQFLGILLRKRASMLVVPFSETEEE